MAGASYDTDIIAWAQEQAELLRTGRFDALDIEHLADENRGRGQKRTARTKTPDGRASGIC